MPAGTTLNDTVRVLNQLLILHQRSLPMYLHDARPWDSEGETARVLQQIFQDQNRTADRIGSLIMELGGRPENGRFPMRYTSLNDLSSEYLVGRMLQEQRQAVGSMENLAQRLHGNSLASELAAEAVGAAKANLDSLRELKG